MESPVLAGWGEVYHLLLTMAEIPDVNCPARVYAVCSVTIMPKDFQLSRRIRGERA